MNPLDPRVLAVAVVVSVSVVVTLVRVVCVVVVVVAAMTFEPTAWIAKKPKVSTVRRVNQYPILLGRSAVMPDQGSLRANPRRARRSRALPAGRKQSIRTCRF